MPKGLGRIHAPDTRDQGFMLNYIETARTYRYWYEGAWRGDQGYTPECVAYAWSHFYCGSPTPHPSPAVEPDTLYHEAQVNDEWPGEDYDGTSVRGGAKALAARGVIGPYMWAWEEQTVATNILEKGPVVIGINFYEGMENPDPVTGWVTVSGEILGGHAMLADGVNVNAGKIRLLNSWGREWGRDGRCWMSMTDFARLLHEDGEACMAVES